MNTKELVRKFFLSKLPNFVNSKPVLFDRLYIFQDQKTEVRIQKYGDKFEFERKAINSGPSRETQIFEITKNEFSHLSKLSFARITREVYTIPDPKYLVEIKVYKEPFEGLIRAEVEFKAEEEAREFVPYEWMGPEITDSPLGKDGKLINLSSIDFKKELNGINN